jgi:hypothetical protein
MKGKKIDNEFVSQYISKCISNKILSSEKMIAHASDRIDEIDQKIKEVEIMKIERSKLLDIISSFKKSEKKSLSKEIETLSLYRISNHDICRSICECILRNESVNLTMLFGTTYAAYDIIVCIKQLLEHKVISKHDNLFVKGSSFDEYYGTILKCD